VQPGAATQGDQPGQPPPPPCDRTQLGKPEPITVDHRVDGTVLQDSRDA